MAGEVKSSRGQLRKLDQDRSSGRASSKILRANSLPVEVGPLPSYCDSSESRLILRTRTVLSRSRVILDPLAVCFFYFKFRRTAGGNFFFALANAGPLMD